MHAIMDLPFADLPKNMDIYEFSKNMGFPVKLADINATLDDMDAVITKALSGIDVRKWPYEVTPDMILDAVKKIEEVSF